MEQIKLRASEMDEAVIALSERISALEDLNGRVTQVENTVKLNKETFTRIEEKLDGTPLLGPSQGIIQGQDDDPIMESTVKKQRSRLNGLLERESE